MLSRRARLLAMVYFFGVASLSSPAATLYVDINSTNPIPPFSSWATAATNIQDAVDAASFVDAVLVSNGVYQYGGRTLPGSALTNRLIITNGIPVRSVNGPLVTTIVGHQVPSDITGDSAVRCVYLANGSAVEGFTITQGATLTGGNDVENGGDTSGAGILEPGGGPEQPVINCVIVSNVAGDFGGGVYGATIYNCLVVSNTAVTGGGSYGGGTFQCTSVNCTITANTADIGAGDAFSFLVNCIVTGNFATLGKDYDFDTLDYCCTTPDPGGTGNVIADPLFVNAAAGNYRLQAGSPCVNAGDGIYVTTGADLAGNPRVSGGTVDIGAYELQFHYVDINSTDPVSPFSSWATAATNIQDAVDAASNYDEVLVTNGVYQYGGRLVEDGLSHAGYFVTNRLVVTNPITVQSMNGPSASVIEGLHDPGYYGYGPNSIRCAYLDGGAELIGFNLTNGSTQQYEQPDYPNSTDSASDGGGAYSPHTNATLYNCSLTGNLATGQGGGACGLTLINCSLTSNTYPQGSSYGGLAGAAAYSTLTNCLIAQNTARGAGAVYHCSLDSCTLSNNFSFGGDGGAYGSTLNKCLLIKNEALLCGGAAASMLTSCTLTSNIGINEYGGAYQCTLSNCLLSGNSILIAAPGNGGGANASDLYNCTIVNNTAASSGGGVFDCTLSNCIVVSNSAPANANYVLASTNSLNFCCTTPLPPGLGNITNDPLFVNPAAGDFHLQSNSPCINAGNNAYVSTTNDLDGNPRISGGTVDIGAYEFQNPASIISYAWLEQYGFATDGSADFADPDHDGMNNYQEWIAGTDPTNPLSLLQMLSPTPIGTNVVVTWQSETNITYFLQRATNLNLSPAFQTIATNLPGQTGNTSYTDTNAPAPGPYYYRVGVQQP